MIKKLCISELQRVIYELVSAVGYRIFDDVPKDPEFPYFVFGASTTSDYRAKDRHGEEVTQIIDAFSVYEGYKEMQAMMSAIVQILSDNPLTMTGFSVVHRGYEFYEQLYETLPDGRVVRHGVLKYRLKIEQL